MSDVYIGIDPSAESFAASILWSPESTKTAPKPFDNTLEGIKSLEEWLQDQGVSREDAVICVENTGVYGEALCYQLHEDGYRLSLLDPRTVWKAFRDDQPKNDPVDSQKVAEYGFRYSDKLRLWQPQEVIIEQVRVILSTREQLVNQRTAALNARTTLSHKVIQTPPANRALDSTTSHLLKQIKALEKELKRLIRSQPTLMQGVSILMSAPGVKWLLAAHLMVLTEGFTDIPRYRKLAQYLGISPNETRSGTSVHKPARSRRYGPPAVRKLLHLAARSLRTHDERTQRYFLEKKTVGKPKPVIMNNIANKLLKRLCAMMRSGSPYDPQHQSVNPRLLALA